MIRIGQAAFALVFVSSLSMPTLAASASSAMPNSTNADQNAANGQSSTSNSPNTAAGQPGNPAASQMSQKLSSDLTQSGYTEIKIVPESFLVRAKDPQGKLVTMVIHPYQVTKLTDQIEGANSASDANRAGANNNATATPEKGATGSSQPATPGGSSKP
jgi:hypothetical protein